MLGPPHLNLGGILKIVNIPQQSDEWLEWRRQGIGASDAPIIMRTSPWSSVSELYQQKIGLRFGVATNSAMRRGIELEPQARAAYEAKTGIKMPPVVGQHEVYTWARASLDGMNGVKGLEIKCPGLKVHAEALEGRVPSYYLDQIHHQMLVAELDSIDYFSFDGRNGVIVTVNRDLQREQQIIHAESLFWEAVVAWKNFNELING